MSQIIMSWSKCTIKDGISTGKKEMPAAAEMSALGVINDKSTSLEATDGEELKATASGGVQVAYEQHEGGFQLTTRVKEPANVLFERYGLGKPAASGGDFEVKTHVVQSVRAVEVTPKNVGATGIKAPQCTVKFKPGRSEDEGEFVDITYVILPILNDDFEVEHWYSRFKKVKPASTKEAPKEVPKA